MARARHPVCETPEDRSPCGRSRPVSAASVWCSEFTQATLSPERLSAVSVVIVRAGEPVVFPNMSEMAADDKSMWAGDGSSLGGAELSVRRVEEDRWTQRSVNGPQEPSEGADPVVRVECEEQVRSVGTDQICDGRVRRSGRGRAGHVEPCPSCTRPNCVCRCRPNL